MENENNKYTLTVRDGINLGVGFTMGTLLVLLTIGLLICVYLKYIGGINIF